MRFWGFELVLLLVQIQVEFVGEADAACEVAVEVRGIRDSSFMVDVQSLGVCLFFVFGIAVGAGE